MSAWPSFDPVVAREAAAETQDDAWHAERLKLVTRVMADRALAP